MASSKKGPAVTTAGRPSPELMEKLKTFVRSRGGEFLRDPNITSIGVGYKRKDGKPTRELSIQFTVEQKAVPEALAELSTKEIPSSLVIDGIEVPTDVLQRSYAPGFRVVEQIVTNPRKVRRDPIVPGISLGNRRVQSAGTVACIVYDRTDGTPYVLSNWHVLHGPSGEIGDDAVQPGPADDNRVKVNRLGRLVRSYLGAAGDCAIATIEDRGFSAEILDLGVEIDTVGEAELDDKVIKSGRTTGVTHGIVTRVHTLALVNYGGDVGEREVGGFEIGPDPALLAADGEVSKPGDSGACWVFKDAAGNVTRTMAGLHFAGEGPGDPNEHALACYPQSVLEKLGVRLSAAAAPGADGESGGSRGYDPNFLGRRVSLPILTNRGREVAHLRDGTEVISYTHFSLALNRDRRFAMWVAWNIDGSGLRRLSRKGIPFVLDPEIPTEYQVGESLYGGNRVDRGHLARRADLLWGSLAEAKQANRDSFFFTNITPQMDDFNQSSQGGLWGRLEDAVFSDVDVEDLRVTVFGGPIFSTDDREYRGVLIPREYFKVIVFVEGGDLRAKAFLLTQSLNALEALDLDAFRVYEVTLGELEERCDFRFSDDLRKADGMVELLASQPEALVERKPLESLKQIRW